jgi:hypothetical protein
MDTSKFIEKYKAHESLYTETIESFKSQGVSIQYPIAYEMLSDLSNRIISNFKWPTFGEAYILTLTEKDQLYSSFILYRSLLEHFYKSFFIFAKTIEDKSDDIAEKYQKHYMISECLAEQAGVLEMEDLLNESDEKTDFITFITAKMPELTGFDKDNQREISAAVKDFNLKAIIKFFSNTRSNKADANLKKITLSTLPEYSFVSTFTHGGSYASRLMKKFKEQNTFQEQLSKIVSIAFTSCCMSKENIFSTYEVTPGLLELIKRFQEIRKL